MEALFMLYIFISGFYKRYRDNLYRTLFLPKGMINKYTFNSDGLTIVLNKIEGNKTDAIIVFVDRYCGGTYRYYPIRKAIFKKYRTEGEYAKIYVELREYIFPKNPEAVNIDIARMSDIPRKSTNEDTTDDGQYISVQDSILSNNNTITNNYYVEEEGWQKAVECLKTKKVFLVDQDKPADNIDITNINEVSPFFFRLECNKIRIINHSYQEIEPALEFEDKSKVRSYFHSNPGSTLVFKIYFYFPLREVNINAKVKLTLESDSISDDRTIIAIPDGYPKSSIDHKYTVPYSECDLRFDIIDERESNNKRIIGSGGVINIRPNKRILLKWTIIVLLSIIYVFSDFIGEGLDIVKLDGIILYIKDNYLLLLKSTFQIGTIIAITKLNEDKKLF